MQHSLVLLSCCCTITVIVTIITLAARRERGKTGGRAARVVQEMDRMWNGRYADRATWTPCCIHFRVQCEAHVCVCPVTVTRTHLIVCRKRTLSLISSGILLRMCLRALAFSFRSWNSCSGRSIMNSAKKNKNKKRKRLLAPRHKIKMCVARTRACRQLGVASLLFCFILSGGRNRLCFSAADNKDG